MGSTIIEKIKALAGADEKLTAATTRITELEASIATLTAERDHLQPSALECLPQ
ncbi:MAG: hypothetical protein LBK60_07925 [Verrucomicrobiales bacterium]|nr:hypothetical protein [Verrucomicrobiales bacterium]